MMWKHIRCFSRFRFVAAAVAATRQTTVDTLSCTPHDRARERERARERMLEIWYRMRLIVRWACVCHSHFDCHLILKPSHRICEKHLHVNQQPFRSKWREVDTSPGTCTAASKPKDQLCNTRWHTHSAHPHWHSIQIWWLLGRLCIGEKYERDSNMANAKCVHFIKSFQCLSSSTHGSLWRTTLEMRQGSGKNWARMGWQRNLISFDQKSMDISIDIRRAVKTVPNLSPNRNSSAVIDFTLRRNLSSWIPNRIAAQKAWSLFGVSYHELGCV